MAKRMSTELMDDVITNENEKRGQEQQDKCEGIGKYADMEDKKTMKRRSLSESSTKRTLSSKSLFTNLFSRKKVSSLQANIKDFNILQTFFLFQRKTNLRTNKKSMKCQKMFH